MKRTPLTPENKPIEKPEILINFNRKILGYDTMQTLKDTLASQGMISGSAITGVIDDLLKLRYLCEAIVEAQKNGDAEDVQQAVEILGLVI